jgi:hypothetical protein
MDSTTLIILSTLLGPVIATIGALGGKRLLDVPSEIRRNDTRIRHRDDSLATWVRDDDRKLQVEVRRIDNRMASQGQGYSGARITARQAVRNEVIHRYEDQLTEAEQLVDVIRAEERCSHRFVRWAVRRPLPELTAPDRVADLVVSWQQREPLPGDMGLAA